MRIKLILSSAIGIGLGIVLLLTLPSSQATMDESAKLFTYPITLIPDQMRLSGDVTTHDNCSGILCSWLQDMPPGAVMLGVDPTSVDPADWKGGGASVDVFFPDIYSPTVVVFRLTWPHQDGRGLWSVEQDRSALIALDGHNLWSKRTTRLGTSGDYYAAEHKPILTTIVLTQSITHTLAISVSPHTVWDLSQIELVAHPYPTMTKGIGYSPFRDCQYPGGSSQPSIQAVEEDLFRLFHTSNAIRTYSATGINGEIPQLANAIGLPVFAGVWINGAVTEAFTDDLEVQSVIDLACNTDLSGVIVGNEYYLRHPKNEESIDYLLIRIQQVKNGIWGACGKDVPVTTAEVDHLLFGWDGDPPVTITGTHSMYRPILDEINFVMVHIYPFWHKMPIDGAARFTINRYKSIQKLLEREYPGQNKWAIIGETGWPSGGLPNDAAIPSLANQRRYLVEFLSLASEEEVEYMYFDAFDELWKIEESGGVGRHWGYSYADRTAKHDFYGVLLPSQLITDSQNAGFSSSSILSPIHSSDNLTAHVYTEWLTEKNFFPTGWMGDVSEIDIYECDRSNPHSGETSIRVSFALTDVQDREAVYSHTVHLPLVMLSAYSGTIAANDWGGIYWQHPPGNWGDNGPGYDLSGVSRLLFWARGDQGGEVIEFFVGGLGSSSDSYPDTIQPAGYSGPIVLSDTWQQFEIDLRDKNLSNVIGGFAWVASKCYNSGPIKFYIDDIAFDLDPVPDSLPLPPRYPFYVYKNAKFVCNHFTPSGFMGDIGDITITNNYTQEAHSGATSIRVSYDAKEKEPSEGCDYGPPCSWSGVYWQDPEGNWGTEFNAGFDLSIYNTLVFQAKGEEGDEIIEFGMGGISSGGAYPDSANKVTKSITLTTEWQEYAIDLTNEDLSRVIGGFMWVASKDKNSQGAVFYLDDIRYEHR
jgi:exo-beta-1,3-glucanase (GH17 family)